MQKRELLVIRHRTLENEEGGCFLLHVCDLAQKTCTKLQGLILSYLAAVALELKKERKNMT